MKKTLIITGFICIFAGFLYAADKIKVPVNSPSVRVKHTSPKTVVTLKTSLPVPSPPSILTAKFIKDARIDGFKNEKIMTEPVVLNDGDNDLSAKVYTGYIGPGIYIYAEVKDDMPGRNTRSGAGIWNGDSVEICVSTSPRSDKNRRSFGIKDFRIGIKAAEPPEMWNYTKNHSIKTEISYKKSGGGYVLEAVIPWREVDRGCFCGLKNRQTAFDLVINDSDEENGRETQARWRGDYSYSMNPSQWGTIVFDTRQ